MMICPTCGGFSRILPPWPHPYQWVNCPECKGACFVEEDPLPLSRRSSWTGVVLCLGALALLAALAAWLP